MDQNCYLCICDHSLSNLNTNNKNKTKKEKLFYLGDNNKCSSCVYLLLHEDLTKSLMISLSNYIINKGGLSIFSNLKLIAILKLLRVWEPYDLSGVELVYIESTYGFRYRNIYYKSVIESKKSLYTFVIWLLRRKEYPLDVLLSLIEEK